MPPVFSVNSDIEETATRSEEISLDYDFFHSYLLALSCGQDYTARIVPRDINVWISRLFLGDTGRGLGKAGRVASQQRGALIQLHPLGIII